MGSSIKLFFSYFSLGLKLDIDRNTSIHFLPTELEFYLVERDFCKTADCEEYFKKNYL